MNTKKQQLFPPLREIRPDVNDEEKQCMTLITSSSPPKTTTIIQTIHTHTVQPASDKTLCDFPKKKPLENSLHWLRPKRHDVTSKACVCLCAFREASKQKFNEKILSLTLTFSRTCGRADTRTSAARSWTRKKLDNRRRPRLPGNW